MPEPAAAGGHNRRLGRSGEDRAAQWYQTAGFEILERNWRCREGEIDLILRGHGLVVFSEVKARSDSRFGFGAEAVTKTKQMRIRKLAAIYLAGHHWAGTVRFDVVAISGSTIDVITDAF